MKATTQSDLKQVSLKVAFLWAAILIAVDSQGFLAAIVGFWVLFVSLPRAESTEDPAQRRRRFARVGIYLGAVMLVFGLNWTNNQIAKSRAETLITAIKAFNQKNQRYPEKLDELVPYFIESVPVAKYNVLGNEYFYYVSKPSSHRLFYVKLPPFGRPTYSFEDGKWSYMD